MSAAGPEIVTGTVVAATASGFSPTMVFLSLLIPAILLYYVYFQISRRRLVELGNKIPGPPGLPIIGNAHELLGTSDGKRNSDLA